VAAGAHLWARACGAARPAVGVVGSRIHAEAIAKSLSREACRRALCRGARLPARTGRAARSAVGVVGRGAHA
jgi:hypothetical protein